MISKKLALAIAGTLAILVVVLHVLRDMMNVWHWVKIGFDLSSYDPWFGIILTIGVIFYLTSTALYHKYRNPIPYMYWALGIFGLFMSVMILYGTLTTWWL